MSALRIPFDGKEIVARDWVAQMRSAVQRQYKAGIRYFDVHRAPNLQSEGWGYGWHSGADFARWWLDVVSALKEEFAEAQFGFPGLSVGGQIDGQRMDAEAFLEGAEAALLNADWIGVQAYWAAEGDMELEEKGSFYALTNMAVKGREYVKFFEALRHSPGIGAAFGQVLSSSGAFAELAWRSEDGQPTDIVDELATRNY
jgi:hypothetical protein